ncbi:MAG TPA: kelch repeat-containing protein, partial [Gemmatimonadales bacterium]|nr:kelch repeat-containing protein [Gemmatimonadales bacterium]
MSPRTNACAAQLRDGRVLVIGGDGAGGVLSSVEAYDETGQFLEVSSLSTGRSQHTCTVLADGRVLVLGGVDPNQSALSTGETYDPSNGTWSPLSQGMAQPRFNHTATLLDDGRVLVVGGEDLAGVSNGLELFDPATGSVTPAAATLAMPRTDHAATRLQDGRVLITGGSDGTHVTAAAEIFDPTTGALSPAPDMSSPRAGHSSTRLLDNRILIAGGNDGQTDLASAEIYEADAGSVHPSLSSLAASRRFHTAVLLPANNNVLFVGGASGDDDLSSAEMYTAWSDLFTPTGSMASPRVGAVGSATPTYGTLLVAGGSGQASAELYGFATLVTDRDDYAPGDQVVVAGAGWEPGETVTLIFNEEPATHAPEIFYSTADSTGYFMNDEYAPEQHDLGVNYLLVAIGSRSQAQTAFTDAAQQTATVLTSTLTNPSAFGQTGTLTATVSRVGGGSHPKCGTVTFKNNGAAFATVALTLTNIATTPADTLPIGNDALVAEFAPDPSGCNYLASTSNTINQVVTVGHIVVTPDNLSRAYGDPNPVFTGSLTGVAPGDNITATYDSVATTASPVGGYPIVPTLVDPGGKLGNYTVTINNGTLTVDAAALSVTGADASRTYGDANPVFSGTLSGVKNGDNITAT